MMGGGVGGAWREVWRARRRVLGVRCLSGLSAWQKGQRDGGRRVRHTSAGTLACQSVNGVFVMNE